MPAPTHEPLATRFRAATGAVWIVWDAIKLWRLRGQTGDATVRDKRFGYVIGMLVGAIGITGVLRFHGLL